jgi:hypothetical protein
MNVMRRKIRWEKKNEERSKMEKEGRREGKGYPNP